MTVRGAVLARRRGTSAGSAEGRLLGASPGARPWLAVAVGSGVVAAGLAVPAALVLAGIVAEVLSGAGASSVAGLLAVLALLAAARAVAVGAGGWAGPRAASAVTGHVRGRLLATVDALGPAGLDRERSGELTSVATAGIDALEGHVASYLPAQWLAGLVPVLIVVAVAVLDPWTVPVLLVTGPVLVAILALIGRRVRHHAERRFGELRWMSALFLDLLAGIATLKLFGRSAEQAGTIERVSRQHGATTMEVLGSAFQSTLVLEWGTAVAMAVVAVEVSLRLMVDAISFERALAILILTPEFFAPLRVLAQRYHLGAAGRPAAERIDAILGPDGATAPAVAARSAVSPTGPWSVAPPSIELDGVRFAWPGRAPALDGLTARIPAGSLTVVAGPSGAGKSTLVAALVRLVEPEGGSILVDGRPLASIEPDAWRAAVGWVPQRPHLVHGSVADNLRLAAPAAADDALGRALEDADAAAFVAALPDGPGSQIGEDGIRLSGGQRQRLAIARGLVRDAPLYVLDEPTAHLDAASERRVVDVLRRRAGPATVVVVAHRPAVVMAADHAIVIEAGRVVAEGPPAALLGPGEPLRRWLEDADGRVDDEPDDDEPDDDEPDDDEPASASADIAADPDAGAR